MGFQHLEINRFASDGSVLRKIRALPGRITVFRSQLDSELDRFRAAIEGKVQEDRFSVLLDGSAFRPQDHVFVGCGPLDESPPHESVANFLSRWGNAPQQVEAVLLQFGLGGLGGQPCSSLTPQQWESLRVVAYSSGREASRVIVLHDPFVNTPEQFRDKIADRLATFAWEAQAIVIVTKLTYRPQSWIENDYIARVQLERPRQSTIGFGGGDLGNSEQIAQLRKELGVASPAPHSPSDARTTGVDLLATGNYRNSRERWVALISSPVVLGGVVTICLVLISTLFIVWERRASLPVVAPAPVASAPAHGEGDNSTHSGMNSSKSSPSHGPGELAQSNVANPQGILTPPFHRLPEDLQVAWTNALKPPQDVKEGAQAIPGDRPVDSGGTAPIDQPEVITNSPLQPLYDELTRQG